MKRSAAGLLLAVVLSTAAGSVLRAAAAPTPLQVTSHELASAPAIQAAGVVPVTTGLPAWGGVPVSAELAPRDSGLRPPVRTPHATTTQLVPSPAAARARARATASSHRGHAHAQLSLRRNAPVTLGNPPPASRS